MKKFIVLLIMLLSPVCASAEYTVYLQNGSRISGIISVQDRGEMMTVYLKEGSMNLQKSEVLTVEEYEMPAAVEGDETGIESPDADVGENRGKIPARDSGSTNVPTDDVAGKISALKDEFDTVSSEIRTLETEEARLVSFINETSGSRQVYNQYQLRQLENELMPHRQDLQTIQSKKVELLDRRNTLAEQIRELQ